MVKAPDISLLVDKLGHSLQEVRVAALKSFLSKLKLEILFVEDICQEKLLFVRLLEWFNFDNCSDEDLVLDLLLKLIENRNGAENLLRIGGVEFMSELRANIPQTLLPRIDEMLHRLLTLYDVTAPESSVQLLQKSHVSGDRVPPSSDITQSALSSSDYSSFPSRPYGRDELRLHNLETIAEVSKASSNFNSASAIDAEDVPHIFAFPWRPLTHSDKHVLDSAKASLMDSDPAIVLSSCQFIHDVLLNDFPAEIFLQKPGIVDSVLKLVMVRKRKSFDVHLEALNFLTELSVRLLHQVKKCKDPEFHTAGVTDTSPGGNLRASSSVVEDLSRILARSRTETHVNSSICSESTIDGPFKGGKEFVDSEIEEIICPSDKISQLNLPQYCTSSLTSIDHLLNASDATVICKVVMLSNILIELLTISLDLESLKNDRGTCSNVIFKDILQFMKSLANATKHHRQESETLAGSSEKLFKIHKAISDSLTVLLSRATKVVLNCSSKDDLTSLECVLDVAQDCMYDYSVETYFPSARKALEAFSISFAPDLQSRLESDTKIKDSILALVSVSGQEKFGDLSDLASNIDNCHLAIGFTETNFDLIDRLINAASDCCGIEDSVYLKVRSVLLKFMNSPVTSVREYAYQKCCQFTEKSLEIESSSVTSKLSSSLRFLLSEDLLSTIIRKGLQDSSEAIKTSSSRMLCLFLNSQLLFDSALWNFFIDNLMQFLVILQCYTCKDSQFGKTLLDMVNEDRNSRSTLLNIPSVDKLRGCLRLLYHSDQKIRVESVGMLVWYLAKEPHGHAKLPSFSSSPLPKLHNLFYSETQTSIKPDSADLGTQLKTLKNVLEIAKSEKLDPNVKKSGFDQLAIILQDRNLHQQFLSEDGLGFVLRIFGESLERSSEDTIIHSYMPSCIVILVNLFMWQNNTRHKYSHDSKMFYNLVRSALVLKDNVGAMTNVRTCLALLLFDEILGSSTEEVFALPEIVVLNFRLPFKAEAVKDERDTSELPSFPTEKDSRSKKYLEQIIVQNKLKERSELPVSKQAWFDASDIQFCIGACLNQILSAESHYSVCQTLDILQLYILTANYAETFREYLGELDFDAALGRFLAVAPGSADDQNLLAHVLQFLTVICRCGSLEHVPGWFFGIVGDGSVIPDILEKASEVDCSEKSAKSHAHLVRSSLQFIVGISQRFRDGDNCMASPIISGLVARIRLSDSSDSYDLPSLQMSLAALSKLTRFAGWSEHVSEATISRMFPALISVLRPFFGGGGGGDWTHSSLSFMGCAVTRTVLLTIAHLARELCLTFKSDSVWLDSWTVSLSGSDEPLDWLVAQFLNRCPHIRALAMNVAAIVAASTKGQQMLTNACKHFPGGIWSSLLSVSLDGSECCAVRTQALSVLSNLTKDPHIPTIEECNMSGMYVGPSVVDEDGQTCASGLRALEMLLDHCNFFPEVSRALHSYFPFTTFSLHFASMESSTASMRMNALQRFNMESARISLQKLDFDIHPSQALSTPSFISALCCFVQNVANLLPDFTISCAKKMNIFQELLRLLDFGIISQIVNLQEGHDKGQRVIMLFRDMTSMAKGVLQCLSALAQLSPSVVPNESLYIGTVARFLCLVKPGNVVPSDISAELKGFLSCVSRTLRGGIQMGGSQTLWTVVTVLVNNWQEFAATALFLVQPANGISGEFLYLLTQLLSRSASSKKGEHFVSLFNSGEKSQDSLGFKLCTNLIPGTQLESSSSKSAEECLKTLLAFSETAKLAASQSGTVENLIDEIKQIHVRMNSMNLMTKNKFSIKEENLSGRLVSIMNTLRNLMYRNESAKKSALQCGLTGVVTKLWPWCTVDPNLMFATLQCLSVYTAGCHGAAVSLSMSLTANAINRHAAASNTVVHLLLKAAQKEADPATCTRGGGPGLTPAIFTLLATISLTTECRGVMWKANFLQKFSNVPIPKKLSTAPAEDAFILWLSLLVNVSFTADGQQMIVRMNGSIDKLIQCVKNQIHPQMVSSALIILHNVSFHSSNKAKLLANSNLIPTVMDVLSNSNDEKHVLMASAMFWALLHNNQKTKVSLKNAALLPVAHNRLNSVKSSLASNPNHKDLFNTSCYLQTVITNLSS